MKKQRFAYPQIFNPESASSLVAHLTALGYNLLPGNSLSNPYVITVHNGNIVTDPHKPFNIGDFFQPANEEIFLALAVQREKGPLKQYEWVTLKEDTKDKVGYDWYKKVIGKIYQVENEADKGETVSVSNHGLIHSTWLRRATKEEIINKFMEKKFAHNLTFNFTDNQLVLNTVLALGYTRKQYCTASVGYDYIHTNALGEVYTTHKKADNPMTDWYEPANEATFLALAAQRADGKLQVNERVAFSDAAKNAKLTTPGLFDWVGDLDKAILSIDNLSKSNDEVVIIRDNHVNVGWLRRATKEEIIAKFSPEPDEEIAIVATGSEFIRRAFVDELKKSGVAILSELTHESLYLFGKKQVCGLNGPGVSGNGVSRGNKVYDLGTSYNEAIKAFMEFLKPKEEILTIGGKQVTIKDGVALYGSHAWGVKALEVAIAYFELPYTVAGVQIKIETVTVGCGDEFTGVTLKTLKEIYEKVKSSAKGS